MPDVVYGGDATGAVGAAAEAQAAIDSVHGKTEYIDLVFRQAGGSGGGAASDLAKVGDNAERARRATSGLSDDLDHASRAARGMDDGLDRAADHVAGMADDAEKLRDHLESVDKLMRGGAPSSTERPAAGMRGLAADADKVRDAIGGFGSGSSGMRALESGASGATRGIKELGSGVGSTSRFIVDAGGGIERLANGFDSAATSGGRFMAGVSGGAQQVSRDLVPMEQGADGAYRSVARLSGAGRDVEKLGDSFRGIDAVGRVLDNAGGGSGGGIGGLVNGLSALDAAAVPSAGAVKAVGLAGVVSAAGMGILGAAVAGVGLGGVAEDFMHNNQLMNAGQDAVRGFSKQFSAMRSETTAAGLPQMDAVKGSFAGVGHELASIGAANIGSVLQDTTALGNSATTAMKKLEPAIPPAIGALTALAGAALGAFGDSGPAVTSFANNLTAHAPQIQATTSALIDTMSGLGNATVDAYSAFGTADTAVKNVVQPGGKPGFGQGSIGSHIADLGRSILGGKSISPLSAHPAGTSLFGPAGQDLFGTNASTATAGPAGGAAPAARPAYHPTTNRAGVAVGNFDSLGAQGLPKLPPGGGGSPDSAWARGMTGKQAYESLFQKATGGYPSTGPMPTGVGAPPPRTGGPGSSGGGATMPAAIAGGLGFGGGTAIPGLMSSMQSAVAGGGGATGAAMIQHVQKAVNVAAPAAQAGGASMGAAMNTGMAQGSNSTQHVVDTVTIQHSKHIIDIAKDALGIHSPSTEFDYMGQMTWAGFGRGQQRASTGAFGSMASSMGGVLSAAQNQARRTSLDYDGSSGVTVSVAKPSADDYEAAQQAAADRKASFGVNQQGYKPGSEGWWAAHDNRAGQLAAGREGRQRSAIGGMTHDERAAKLLQNHADNHERALAQLGVSGHTNPFRDKGSALNNANPFGKADPNNPMRADALKAVINPFHTLGLKAAGTEHGQNMASGVVAGLDKGTSAAQAGVSKFSQAVQGQHKKDHGIASPATVWIGDGADMAAGVGVGFGNGTPGVISDISAAASTVSQAMQGPLSDYGLQAGFTYAQSLIDGSSRELKKANYQALGIPDNLSLAAMANLTATGLLQAGSGASTIKTPSGGPATVTVPGASQGAGLSTGPQTIILQVQHLEGDRMSSIADERIELAFDELTSTYQTL